PAEAWAALAAGRPTALFYWYRQGPGRLVHRTSPNDILGYGIPGLVTIADPPLGEDEACVVLDGDGRLLELHARPPLGPPEKHRADWAPLSAAAGLERERFRPVTPVRDPGAFAAERAAWEGEAPDAPDYPLRVEAAARGGRPVYFWVGEEGAADRTAGGDL